MTSTTTDQITGFSGSLAVKQPVRLATTAPIVLEGLVAVDGVVPAEGDRILVKDQADASQNGIYVASSGLWERAVDLDATGKVVKGTQVWATDGVSQPGTLWFATAANPIVLGVSLLTWQIGSLYQAAASIAAGIAGAANKATPAAADKFPFLDNAAGTLRQFSWTQMLAAFTAAIGMSNYLPLTGGALTGDLAIAKANPLLTFNASSGGNYLLAGKGGVSRWQFALGDGTTESGGNAGSDFALYRYSDAGALLKTTLAISRASGLITLGDGQLKFPATQNPSSNPNTLDDYEEGTWTPTFSATGATFAYASQVGRYTKIGNLVVGSFRVALATSGNTLSSNVLSVAGFPFTIENTVSENPYALWQAATSTLVTMSAALQAGTTTAVIGGATAASSNAAVALNANAALHATAGSIMSAQFHYMAS